MATHLKDLKVGDKTYYISHTGETVYCSTERKGKGTRSLKGLKYKNNEIIKISTGKEATDMEVADCIKK